MCVKSWKDEAFPTGHAMGRLANLIHKVHLKGFKWDSHT
jgi:hypothetical protein